MVFVLGTAVLAFCICMSDCMSDSFLSRFFVPLLSAPAINFCNNEARKCPKEKKKGEFERVHCGNLASNR